MKRHFFHYLGWVCFVAAIVSTAAAVFDYILLNTAGTLQDCARCLIIAAAWYGWAELV